MSMGGHRRLFEIIPKSLQIFWDKWDLQGLVIVSLTSQILLLMLGNRRKYEVGVFTRAVVWISYMVTDGVATFALGVITSKVGDYYEQKNGASHDINPQLLAFWASFFLMHSGGPWTITAYSLEDNELWPRHLFASVSQTLVTFYVIILSWKSTSWLSRLSLPMLVAGSINYGQKVWSLYSATTRHHRDSLLSSLDLTMDSHEDSDKYESKKASVLFHHFIGLFVSVYKDVVLSTKRLSEDIEYFGKIEYEKAFDVVERELEFAFDVFYTRASLIYNSCGQCFAAIIFYTTVIVSGLYFEFARNEHQSLLDGILTGMLLSVAFGIGIWEFSGSRVFEWASDQFSTLKWLAEWIASKERRLDEWIASKPKWLEKHTKSSKSLPQYNLLSLCFENRGISGKVTLTRKLKDLLKIPRCDITADLKESIFTSLQRKSAAMFINGTMSC